MKNDKKAVNGSSDRRRSGTSTAREGGEKVQFHTRISPECYDLINILSENYPSKSKFIEEAVRFFAEFGGKRDRYQEIWNRARKLNMVLVGKTTFMSYISGDYEKAWKENVATEVIEWVSGKPIQEITLYGALYAIKEMWIAANYFTEVEIEKIEEDDEYEKYRVLFFHTFNRKFGEFWSNYFKIWLENNINAEVDASVRNESFILNVRGKKRK